MNAETLIKEIYRAYRGKGDSKAPVWGDEKSSTALSIANRKQREWARDPNNLWRSIFSTTSPNETGTVATAGTTTLTGTGTYFTDYNVGDTISVAGETDRTIDSITSDTSLEVTVAFSTTASGLHFTRTPIISSAKSYNLHRNFYLPSDEIKIETTDQDFTFSTTKPQARGDGSVYICGNNPKKVCFYDDIQAQAVGGELIVPAYYIPNDLSASTDLVSVDNPDWLAIATAAELARNDPAYSEQFANLMGMANDLYVKMALANNSCGFMQGGIFPTSVPYLGDLSGSSEEW